MSRKEDLLEGLSLKEMKKIAKKKKIKPEVSSWLGFSTARATTRDHYIKLLKRSRKVSAQDLKDFLDKQHLAGGRQLIPTISNIKKAIEKYWKPEKLKREKDFQKDLYLSLKKIFGAVNIRKEYGLQRPDIIVKEKFPIELKYNFGMKDFHRLSSQLDIYKKGFDGKTFLVFCGIKAYDDGFARYEKELKRRYKRNLVEIKKFSEEL